MWGGLGPAAPARGFGRGARAGTLSPELGLLDARHRLLLAAGRSEAAKRGGGRGRPAREAGRDGCGGAWALACGHRAGTGVLVVAEGRAGVSGCRGAGAAAEVCRPWEAALLERPRLVIVT